MQNNSQVTHGRQQTKAEINKVLTIHNRSNKIMAAIRASMKNMAVKQIQAENIKSLKNYNLTQ